LAAWRGLIIAKISAREAASPWSLELGVFLDVGVWMLAFLESEIVTHL
jgi:hypothetical protein